MATSVAVLAAVSASPAVAAARCARGSGDLAPCLGIRAPGRFSPSISLALRAVMGADPALLGPAYRVYRAAPELRFGLQPAPRLEIFAAAGAGPARVVPQLGAGPEATEVTLTASLGARFTWQGVPVSALARAESVAGHGLALTLGVRLDLAAAR